MLYSNVLMFKIKLLYMKKNVKFNVIIIHNKKIETFISLKLITSVQNRIVI